MKVSKKCPWESSTSGWWRAKHVVLWEEHNGPVPPNHCLRFKDGNKLNISLENLILVTRAQHIAMTRLGYNEAPEDLRPAVANLAKLEVKIGERTQKGSP